MFNQLMMAGGPCVVHNQNPIPLFLKLGCTTQSDNAKIYNHLSYIPSLIATYSMHTVNCQHKDGCLSANSL